ncbi:hypothetical protein BUY79_07145 [Staphylococcus equorum]|uniref:transposase n=2 Tax=Staphylococcus equorum TaxID=246432 RepID=UPI000D1CC3F9|nr:transposase [Staphylococcus equorum]PTE42130.1 hypothetical protein BUY77_11030 [Staphylococcus equorum]PTE84042.1 hypothetical protein BUY79_07145 [Staphylococcus equorum]PTF11708.1 hypothetical protein BUY81_04870 [Staphylococcus equorum]RIL45877.1 transposase [Staphylococcus equorum]
MYKNYNMTKITLPMETGILIHNNDIAHAVNQIEAALSDSIRMMWLSQNQKPSYRTINRFRVHPIMDKLLKSLFVNFRT